MKNRLPKIATWLFALLSTKENKISLIGDVEEDYKDSHQEKGIVIAHLWLWFQVLLTIPSFIKRTIYWSFAMLMNYFKIAFRNFRRNKGYSFINISGLAIGMVCCILILLWVKDELSYDTFHEKADRIYRIESDIIL